MKTNSITSFPHSQPPNSSLCPSVRTQSPQHGLQRPCLNWFTALSPPPSSSATWPSFCSLSSFPPQGLCTSCTLGLECAFPRCLNDCLFCHSGLNSSTASSEKLSVTPRALSHASTEQHTCEASLSRTETSFSICFLPASLGCKLSESGDYVTFTVISPQSPAQCLTNSGKFLNVWRRKSSLL